MTKYPECWLIRGAHRVCLGSFLGRVALRLLDSSRPQAPPTRKDDTFFPILRHDCIYFYVFRDASAQTLDVTVRIFDRPATAKYPLFLFFLSLLFPFSSVSVGAEQPIADKRFCGPIRSSPKVARRAAPLSRRSFWNLTAIRWFIELTFLSNFLLFIFLFFLPFVLPLFGLFFGNARVKDEGAEECWKECQQIYVYCIYLYRRICWTDDSYVFLRTAGGYDAGIICHTRLETESIMKARVPSTGAIGSEQVHTNVNTRTVCTACWRNE